MYIVVALVFMLQLLNWQVFNESAKINAERNTKRTSVVFPSRGLIYDRNGELLVFNKAAYDLMVSRKDVEAFDTMHLCKLLDLTPAYIADQFKKNRKKRSFVLHPLVSAEQNARLVEVMSKYPGFYLRTRTIRHYQDTLASHVLGYLGEVSPKMIEEDAYYQGADYVGQNGVEKSYEHRLRGEKGLKHEIVNAIGELQGSYAGGSMDKEAVTGDDLILTLDSRLQHYAELLLKNKRGSIVAIEPETGEILALVSSPGFSLERLVGHSRTKSFELLSKDPYKPLINRAIMGRYSPGSTLKPLFALIGLQEGVINKRSYFTCNGKDSRPIRCSHYHGTKISLKESLEESCNPYYWEVFNAIVSKGNSGFSVEEGYSRWAAYLKKFGIGSDLGIDIPYAGAGVLKDAEFYDKLYKKRWKGSTIRSLSIGQGELEVTPLQLANCMAMIANRGYYITPHVVRNDTIQREKHASGIDKEHFLPVIEGLQAVFEGRGGTARYYKNPRLKMAGKTGTVENSGEDHSLFIGFAPVDNPKIAICCIVENAGFGSLWSAPISSLIMEKYIMSDISPQFKGIEEKLINSNLLSNE